MRKIKVNLAGIFAILSFLIVLVYWNSWNTFFQQDEWAGLGNFYTLQGLRTEELLKALYLPMFQQGLGHFLFFTPAANYIRYSIFELNYQAYIVLSLILHTIASFFVFLLALRLSRDKVISLSAAVFFVIASSASQAVLWIGTSLPTQLSAIFSIVTIYFWVLWLEKTKRKYFLISIISFVLAIGFKETALFLFVLLPVITFFRKPELAKKILKLTVLAGLIYAIGRVILTGSLNQVYILASTFSGNILKVLLTGITQTIFPQEAILFSTDKLLQRLRFLELPEKNTTAYDLFLQNSVVVPVMYIIALVVIVGAFLYARKAKERVPLLFGLLILIFGLLPLAFITSGELTAVFLAPRGLYISLVGAAIIFGVLTKLVLNKKSVVLIVPLLLLGVHIYTLRGQIDSFVRVGQERKAILNTIKNEYQDLPDKVIFYTQSDKAYYGLSPEENIMPFQSGFGQTLLVWYYPGEQWSKEFLQNRFLWQITDQGYKETDGRGFGYFRDINLLKETIIKYNIPTDSIIAFQWQSEKEVLTDVTEKTRNEFH